MIARSAKSSAEDVSSASISEPPRRILAIDYGTKRLGLAVSDELLFTAQPLLVLPRTNRRDLFRRLRDICKQYRVGLILIGHPLHMTGEESLMSETASRFAAQLRKNLGLEVELLDERLTTWEARETMRGSRTHSARKESHLDHVAAAILLREYLDRRRSADSSSAAGEA
ncbi:MAG TPA: Holliday junction resolvase RuvX [Candidatus Acidoferrum sp.]|nr:Holliday junction resolvase RuvX [Candidatus Acidoferrum sp.]